MAITNYVASASETRRCSVLVFGQTRLFVEAFICLLAAGGAYEVFPGDIHDVESSLESCSPDIVLVDAVDPNMVTSLSSTLRERRPGTGLIVLVRSDEREWKRNASRLGATAIFSCQAEGADLIRLLQRMSGPFKDPAPISNTRPLPVSRGEALLLEQLTARQSDVLRLLARGWSADDIAEALQISRNTVRTHLQNLMAKLNVSCRLEAVALARRTGFLEQPVLAGRT